MITHTHTHTHTKGERDGNVEEEKQRRLLGEKKRDKLRTRGKHGEKEKR